MMAFDFVKDIEDDDTTTRRLETLPKEIGDDGLRLLLGH